MSAMQIRMFIAAGKAAPAPPLGTAIGPRGLNIMQVCKEFNDKTKNMKVGIPIPTVITYKSDRTFTMSIGAPPTSYFLKRAAGMGKGRGTPVKPSLADAVVVPGTVEEPVHTIGLKHIYEIAKLKQQTSPTLQATPLESVCRMVASSAKKMGLVIDKHWDNIPIKTDGINVIHAKQS